MSLGFIFIYGVVTTILKKNLKKILKSEKYESDNKKSFILCHF